VRRTATATKSGNAHRRRTAARRFNQSPTLVPTGFVT
jgi:hypothetical protein